MVGVNLGVLQSDRAAERRRAGAAPGPGVPAATRATTPGWRDPRLWVGVLLVAVSVAAGARLLASADDTVAVWALASDAGAGAEITEADLEVQRVRFADADRLDAYFATEDELPSPLRLVRAVGAGELLPRAAIGDPEASGDTVELPISVDPAQVPPSVRAGSVVSVYVLDRAADAPAGDGPSADAAGADAADVEAGPLLADATVVAAPSPESGFAAVSDRRQLVLAVSEEEAAWFLAAVSAAGGADQAVLTVLRRG